MKTIKFYIFLSLLWLLMMCFSHDYMADKLNQSSAKTTQLLVAGDYELVIDQMTKDDVISSFWTHWQQLDSGLKPVHQDPEVSFNLKGFNIIPMLHDSLMLDVESVGGSEGHFRIELSNQNKSLYYDSEALSLELLNQPMVLSELEWNENPVNNSDQTRQVNWMKLDALDGLVVRFYGINHEQMVIKGIALKHRPLAVVKVPVNENSQCILTNCMRFQSDSMLYSVGFDNHQMASISEFPAWVWLLAAWLTAVFLLYLCQASNAKPYALVSMVFVIIYVFHQHWVAGLESHLQWPLLIMVVAIVVKYRDTLMQINHRAGSVWIATLLLAVLLFLFNKQVEFLTVLPVYFIWALVQQIILGPLFSGYFYKQLKLRKYQCAGLVGVLFSVVHAPNHVLMMATLVAGVAWSYVWLKYENIYANAASHALLAVLFYQAMPEVLLNSARVGIFF